MATARHFPSDVLVNAWVRESERPIRVPARVTAWAEYTVEVDWTSPAGLHRRAWLWQGAVSPRDAEE